MRVRLAAVMSCVWALNHGCSSDGDGQRDDAGVLGDPADGGELGAGQLSECMQTVSRFCALSCDCASDTSMCVTQNGTSFGTGFVTLTWSDAADCEAAYQRDWCGAVARAPQYIPACKAAVESLTCATGGARRPSACEPAPDDESARTCTSDSECQGTHCAKAQRAIDGNPFNQEPMSSGRCASECNTVGETTIFCGSECAPGSGSYCLLGWSCVNSECRCTLDASRPDLRTERCDRKDNDCNGVVDDQPAADESCATVGDGYTCVDGVCQPPA